MPTRYLLEINFRNCDDFNGHTNKCAHLNFVLFIRIECTNNNDMHLCTVCVVGIVLVQPNYMMILCVKK